MNTYTNNYDSILTRAYEYGEKHHPNAPSEHHAAFANSVAYALTSMSSGYGGPSMREHLASRLIVDAYGCGANRCTFEQAVALVEECCYGRLTLQHAIMLEFECCFDDAPGEEELAYDLLATA